MDWSKAKTILILGFVALNLFLGFLLYGGHPAEDNTPAVSYQQAAEYLAGRGWQVYAPEPQAPETVMSLGFRPYAPDFDTVSTAFFGPDVTPTVSRQEGEVPSATYSSGSSQLILNGYGVVFFYGDGSLHTAAADVLAAAAGELLPNLQQTTTGAFVQNHGGLRLSGTYVNLTQSKTAVQGYTQQLVEIQSETKAGPCVSPARAMLSAVQALEEAAAAPTAIESLELCYWAPQLSVQSGQMVTVWQVGFEDGHTILVNAATGEVEAS